MNRNVRRCLTAGVMPWLVGLLVCCESLAGWVPGAAPAATPSAREAAFDDVKEPETPPAVKALIDTLKDKDAEVRKTAVVALGRIGKDARAAVPALTATLKDSDV